jgi:hypothetical protein
MSSVINTEKYDKLCDANKQSFAGVYNKIVHNTLASAGIPSAIREELAVKSEFGLKKYGDTSFQSNFENAMSTPIITHITDELIDVLNYAVHKCFMNGVRQKDLGRMRQVMELTMSIIDLLSDEYYCDLADGVLSPAETQVVGKMYEAITREAELNDEL